jgi:hypothetical protein
LQQATLPSNPVVDHVICSKNSPGDEGIRMSYDLQQQVASRTVKVECVSDNELLELLTASSDTKNKIKIALLVIGADGILLHTNNEPSGGKRDEVKADGPVTVALKCVMWE